MKVIWKADVESEKTDWKKLDRITKEVAKKSGMKIEGPYLPQDASVMYIFDTPDLETMNRGGRAWFEAAAKAKLKVTPLRYEIALSPEEFWGK